jgi:DNA-binding transcriptional LysR family regulator
VDWDIPSVRSFVEISTDFSFTNAAWRLGITQPQLSVRVKKLERQMGFPLFERSTRRVRLTTQGEQLLPIAKRLLAGVTALNKCSYDIRLGIRSLIRIGTVGYYEPMRRALLQDFMSCHANVGVEVESVRSPQDGIEQLVNGKLDVAFLLQTSPQAPMPELETVVLAREPAGLLINADSPLAAKPALAPRDLANCDIALFRRELCAPLHDEFMKHLAPFAGRFVLLHEASESGLLEIVKHRRIPAACVRWWHSDDYRPEGVSHRRLKGTSLEMSYVFARLRGRASKNGEALWRLAKRLRTSLV